MSGALFIAQMKMAECRSLLWIVPANLPIREVLQRVRIAATLSMLSGRDLSFASMGAPLAAIGTVIGFAKEHHLLEGLVTRIVRDYTHRLINSRQDWKKP